MKASYKKDFHHSYLILTEEEMPDYESYPVRMLLNGIIPGMLPCKIHHIDNRLMFYYDITSRQSLSSVCEGKKLGKRELEVIINSLINMMEEMESYLLSPSGLLLMPEYVYLNAVEEVGFCYWPVGLNERSENLRGFTEYLLSKIDHCDQGAVVLGYHFYRKAQEGQICPEEIRKEMYQERSALPEQTRPSDDLTPLIDEEQINREKLQRKKLLEEMTVSEGEDIKQAHPVRTTLAAAGAGLLVFLYLYTFKNQYISPQIAIVIAAAFCIITGVGFAVRKLRDLRRKVPEISKDEYKEFLQGQELEPECDEDSGMISPESLIGEEVQTCLLCPNAGKEGARLIPVFSEDAEEIFLEPGITILGKLEGAVDVVLGSSAVSRLHAKIVCNGTCTLYDMNSKNGTYVNKEEVVGEKGHEIQNGDTVTFADLTYRLQFRDKWTIMMNKTEK